MALPQINTPTYELEVPSTGEKLKYRPFLVKEEKILMIAMESEEQAAIINAVKEIVKACTFDKFDVSSLPIFDVEFVFLNIRAKHVSSARTQDAWSSPFRAIMQVLCAAKKPRVESASNKSLWRPE